MRLRFELNKLDKKMDFEEKKKEFADKLNEIKSRFSGEEKKAEERWDNFRSEVSDAFVHLEELVHKVVSRHCELKQSNLLNRDCPILGYLSPRAIGPAPSNTVINPSSSRSTHHGHLCGGR
jgi:hypothetical protein